MGSSLGTLLGPWGIRGCTLGGSRGVPWGTRGDPGAPFWESRGSLWGMFFSKVGKVLLEEVPFMTSGGLMCWNYNKNQMKMNVPKTPLEGKKKHGKSPCRVRSVKTCLFHFLQNSEILISQNRRFCLDRMLTFETCLSKEREARIKCEDVRAPLTLAWPTRSTWLR